MPHLSVTSLEFSFVFRLFVAMGIGALVGMEREHSHTEGHFAGGRSLPLVAVFGAVTQVFYPGSFPVALALLGVLVGVGYVGEIILEHSVGMTTALATVLTFFYGAMAMHSDRGLVLAVVLGGLTTVLLAGKETVQSLADRIERQERRATVKFLLVALVVLPVLPSREVPWLFGIRPQFVWLMVVFVSGLSFLAYVLAKLVGTERGIGLSGVLGGFVSSTATAVSMSERARRNGSLSDICGFATVVATIAMLPRAVIEVSVVNPALVSAVVVPLAVMALVASLLSVGLFWRVRSSESADTEVENPFRLRSALSFGVVFAVILVVSKQASVVFGARGVYLTAFLSGLADVDSVALSLSTLASEGAISPTVATTGIVLAAVANTLVKIGIAWVLGTRELGKAVGAVLGVASFCGLAALVVF